MADCIFKEIKFDGKEWLLIYLDCMYSLGELPQDTAKLIQVVRGLNNELEYGIALSPLLSRLGKVQASREACHAIVLLRTLAKSKNDELELENSLMYRYSYARILVRLLRLNHELDKKLEEFDYVVKQLQHIQEILKTALKHPGVLPFEKDVLDKEKSRIAGQIQCCLRLMDEYTFVDGKPTPVGVRKKLRERIEELVWGGIVLQPDMENESWEKLGVLSREANESWKYCPELERFCELDQSMSDSEDTVAVSWYISITQNAIEQLDEAMQNWQDITMQLELWRSIAKLTNLPV